MRCVSVSIRSLISNVNEQRVVTQVECTALHANCLNGLENLRNWQRQQQSGHTDASSDAKPDSRSRNAISKFY